MRSYGQYCALAKALDVVGDRWSLLIVRELLLRPCRYSQLHEGLPGIATNLLAERLRALEGHAVVRRITGTYELTDRGRSLAAAVGELVRWGAPLMADKADGEAFRARWLELPVKLMFGGVDPARPEIEVEIRCEGETLTLESAGGRVTVRPGPARTPKVVVTGPPDGVIALLAGRLDKRAAGEEGVDIVGDLRHLVRLRRPDWLTPTT